MVSARAPLSPQALAEAAKRVEPEAVLREILRRKSRTNLSLFARAMWPTVRPGVTLKWNWHLDVICKYLEQCSHPELHPQDRPIDTDGNPERRHRLLINVPPGSMKSLLVGVFWPSWVWLTKPWFQFIYGTYQLQLTMRDANEAHKLMEDPVYKPYIEPGQEWEFDNSQDTKAYYRNTRGGHRNSLSVDSGGTGYRAHCFPAGTLVATEHGPMPIEDFCTAPRAPRVVTRTGLRAVQGARAIPRQPVGEIRTVSGRVLRCTSDHRIFTAERGYVLAQNIRKGDTFHCHGSVSVCEVREAHRHAVVRNTQEDATKSTAVLQQGVFKDATGARETPRKEVSDVWHRITPWQWREVLQRWLHTLRTLFAGLRLPDVQTAISADWGASSILRAGMQGCGAFDCDAQTGKPEIRRRDELRDAIRPSFGDDSGTGSVFVRDLRSSTATDAVRQAQSDSASHRRRHDEQRTMESGNDVPLVPHEAPQIETDAVAEPWSICPGEVTVYDIQVEADHHFFANGILVHNCIVFDDPLNVKKAPTIESLMAAIDWWEQRMSTRENNPGADSFIGIMQRMNELDLIGYLLEKDRLELELDPDHEPYHLVKIPAYKRLKDSTALQYPEDPRTQEGENFFPDRFPEKALKAVKTSLKEVGFEAQFQQNPAPAGGGIFECANLKLWVPHTANLQEFPRYRIENKQGESLFLEVVQLPKPEELSQWIQTWDCAFKGEKDSDFVCGQTWAYAKANFYMMAMKMDKMDISQTMDAIKDMNKQFPQAYPIYIEDKANGPAIITMLSSQIPGLEGVNPEGGKIARANAIAPFVKSGNVILPHPLICDETRDLIGQMRMFPKGYDDAVDAMSQGINQMGLFGGGSYLEALVGMFKHGVEPGMFGGATPMIDLFR